MAIEGSEGTAAGAVDAVPGIGVAAQAVRSSIPQAANITVNKDNVLQAAKIIQNALDDNSQQIQLAFAGLRVVAPGQDPISVQAAAQWNAKLVTDPDSFQNRISQYLGSLQTLADNLRTSAKQYGYTDQEIADALSGVGSPGV
ncbi:MAG TPA: hypothetical protein VHW44_15235 [Pseudonocardiaceae bacterium]|jgi:hypothetical protein|nr:hypothetical protein [Pseudonocardiaceae bacterium]